MVFRHVVALNLPALQLPAEVLRGEFVLREAVLLLEKADLSALWRSAYVAAGRSAWELLQAPATQAAAAKPAEQQPAVQQPAVQVNAAVFLHAVVEISQAELADLPGFQQAPPPVVLFVLPLCAAAGMTVLSLLFAADLALIHFEGLLSENAGAVHGCLVARSQEVPLWEESA